jgi:hypothetical protein
MHEFWLIVTLCAVPSAGEPADAPSRPISSADCAEYRVESSFPSIAACRLEQAHLNSAPPEQRRMIASLCTAGLDPVRLGELPLLSATLGDPA